MPDSLKDLLIKLRAQLAADKKKSVALGLLSIVFLVVIGRLFISEPTPETAQAVSPVVVAKSENTTASRKSKRVSQERTTDSGGFRPKHSNRSVSNQSGVESPHRTSSATKTPVSLMGMPRVLARDIFSTPDWSAFALDSPVLPSTAEKPKDSPGWFTKFGWKLSEYQRERGENLDLIKSELAELELQSTMTGSSRSAYISGRLVREGDSIRGFSVVQIGDRRVTLRKSGISETLTMP